MSFEQDTLLSVPRGRPNLPPIVMDMTLPYEAERRLSDLRSVSPTNAPELMAVFNEATNLIGKYLAWVEYEYLQAQKTYELARAEVILDKAPEAFKKQKDSGIKFNEDFREALVAKDEECSKALDTLNTIKAIKVLLESKFRTFERSYYAARAIAEKKSLVAASPNFSGIIGQTYEEPQDNFMGERLRK